MPPGTFSETKRQAGLLRMLQAGVILSDYATLMVEILKDNARRGLRGHGHAVGKARGPGRAGVRKVKGAGSTSIPCRALARDHAGSAPLREDRRIPVRYTRSSERAYSG